MDTQLAGLSFEIEIYVTTPVGMPVPWPFSNVDADVVNSMLHRSRSGLVTMTTYVDDLEDVDEVRAAWCAGI
jgi:hypothetical protein